MLSKEKVTCMMLSGGEGNVYDFNCRVHGGAAGEFVSAKIFFFVFRADRQNILYFPTF